MDKNATFDLLFLLTTLFFLLVFGVFGVLIGNLKDPKLEAAGWFIITSIFIITMMILVAVKTSIFAASQPRS
ncbi:MAG: hypothetical protein HZB67_04860 [Candidatus Aenigmarchaeota archaeon]|nr:hypothetical protein [Candidatus Aenigmarchaeota archaeon]